MIFESSVTRDTFTPTTMASSRIFVKGLPPTFTDAEFKKHFSSQRDITDAKIFPSRRIGYVGYKTPEDAQKAVKYFNRTFIRMSKIGVEIAWPIQDANSVRESAPASTAQRKSSADGENGEKNALKRKRPSEDEKQEDPKLREFLEVMKPKSKKKAWETEAVQDYAGVKDKDQKDSNVLVKENESDEEYEKVPKKIKPQEWASEAVKPESQVAPDTLNAPLDEDSNESAPVEATAEANGERNLAVSDSDWARSRTSRLLGLLDDDEEEAIAQQPDQNMSEPSDDDAEPVKGAARDQATEEAESSMLTPPSETEPDSHSKPVVETETEAVRSSMRLFIRNLPYDVKEADLEAEFAPFADLEEVRLHFSNLHFFRDEP